MKRVLKLVLTGAAFLSASAVATAGSDNSCKNLPNHDQLQAALFSARGEANGGFSLDMWGTVVNRDGIVCAVAFTGDNRGDQWPGSRVISAQKANTANAFSLPNLALSTANLYTAVQPGGSLYGLQHSNPVDTTAAYKGPSAKYGQTNDPMVGKKIGGVNVFGGGLALYSASGVIVGALGVSGDSSCADHNIAWRTRNNLAGFNFLPPGVGPDGHDGIDYDLTSVWRHPVCAPTAVTIAKAIGAGSD
ncbi:MAG: heme-binding protein [Gammaproteobacteria bacterium]|nr:heme-binding protein [Gammaproteobacteria bacterium]